MKRYIKSASTYLRDHDITSTDDVNELVLYITNDGDLYRRRTLPIISNLAKKMKRGAYDPELAVKAWQYLADDGVRKYDKEFGSDGGKLFLDKATRTEIARELRDYYEEQVREESGIEASTSIQSNTYRHPGFRGGYMYILKHGLGPGTLPKDVNIIQIWSLPNGYTVVTLDKFMDNDDLDEFDIPDETQLTNRLARAGFRAEVRDDGFYDLISTDTGEIVEPDRDDSKYFV